MRKTTNLLAQLLQNYAKWCKYWRGIKAVIMNYKSQRRMGSIAKLFPAGLLSQYRLGFFVFFVWSPYRGFHVGYIHVPTSRNSSCTSNHRLSSCYLCDHLSIHRKFRPNNIFFYRVITGRPGFDPRQRQRIFPLPSASRPALGSTQPPV
jgi:hypothetical protein